MQVKSNNIKHSHENLYYNIYTIFILFVCVCTNACDCARMFAFILYVWYKPFSVISGDFRKFRIRNFGILNSEFGIPNSEFLNSEIRVSPEFGVRSEFFVYYAENPHFFFFKCLIYLDPRTREKYKTPKTGNRHGSLGGLLMEKSEAPEWGTPIIFGALFNTQNFLFYRGCLIKILFSKKKRTYRFFRILRVFVINVHPGEILFTSRSPLNKALLFRLKFPGSLKEGITTTPHW